MTEAIKKGNIVRLRSGSPGHHSRNKANFEKDMADLGIAKDVIQIGQIKDELMSRSIDVAGDTPRKETSEETKEATKNVLSGIKKA